MNNLKNNKADGKMQLSRQFQDLEKGERVAIVKNAAFEAKFPRRIQGRTGEIEGKRGEFYIVQIKDQNKGKKFLISPIHLKKIK